MTTRPYTPLTTPISADDAEQEPAGARVFAEKPVSRKPAITLSTTVQHRGRVITITATDLTADQFCDLLDARGYAAPAPAEWQRLPDGTPLCPKHGTPMRARDKQGDQWWSHNVGTKDKPIYCKGYAGKDSPGYEH